jgi:hypothetical protein
MSASPSVSHTRGVARSQPGQAHERDHGGHDDPQRWRPATLPWQAPRQGVGRGEQKLTVDMETSWHSLATPTGGHAKKTT